MAELSEAADMVEDSVGSVTKKEMLTESLRRRGQLSQVRWSSVRFKNDAETPLLEDHEGRARLDSVDDASIASPSTPPQPSWLAAKEPSRMHPNNRNLSELSREASSGKLRIKNLLDRWDEPTNKSDRVSLRASSIDNQLPANSHFFLSSRHQIPQ